jgi:hypothetical protein
MANQYRKFYLVPEQQSPSGSTGRTISDGGIVWIGEEGTFPANISSQAMSQEEIDEYSWLADETVESGAKTIFTDSVWNRKTYAQIDSYIDSNVVDLASAKAVIKILAKSISAILKHERLIK